jgi:hypothetical protein
MKSRAKPIVSVNAQDLTVEEHDSVADACWKYDLPQSAAQTIIKSKDKSREEHGFFWFSSVELAELFSEEMEHIQDSIK